MMQRDHGQSHTDRHPDVLIPSIRVNDAEGAIKLPDGSERPVLIPSIRVNDAE
mgnify:CR=1 FL=1